MKTSRTIAVIALAIIVWLVTAAAVPAQRNTADQSVGRVTGSVTDPLGQCIPRAELVFETKIAGKKQKYKATTNNDGFYDISLPPRRYQVSIGYVGFKPFRKKNVPVLAGNRNALHIVLEVDMRKAVTVYTRSRG
jgi:hypothetical protein